MAGWNLSCGDYIDICNNEDDFWSIINYFFSNKTNKTTSYKFCFFKSILDNVFNFDENKKIDYYTIFERFSEIYWNLIVKYNLCQIQRTSRFSKSSVEIIIEQFVNKHNVDNACSFDALKEELRHQLVLIIMQKCSIYVIGAFFEDTKRAFYSFNKTTKDITFNKKTLSFLIKHKSILTKINYFEWIKFLEKTNDDLSVVSLAEKLDCSSKRDNLSIYKAFLTKVYGDAKCFYCNKQLRYEEIEMDHFIPWSFVKDDKVWNLVISCKKCNHSKSDKLPAQKYIDRLKAQNNIITGSIHFNFLKNEFISYNDNKIASMYNSAAYNGFDDIWEP